MLTREIFLSTREEKFRISKRPCNVVFYINTNKIQTILFKKFFGVKGAIYYVASATVMFSHVKISSFRLKAHLVFHWYIYNKVLYPRIHFLLHGSRVQSTKNIFVPYLNCPCKVAHNAICILLLILLFC